MPIIILALAVIALDQVSKAYLQANMAPGASVPVIPGIFHITYVLNPGAAFGILEHQRWFFVAVALLLLAVIVYLYPRIPAGYGLLRLGVALQTGGAAGNAIDRLKTGYVVDFFDFRVWPVFNVADIAIVVGVALIVYSILFPPGRKADEDDGGDAPV
ncbi:signal peptidase II [Anaeroselena agilis]|uniref:Lipoprotein signal peptidase n=1 Tax=Anaeroselena agilis TaxID=3063788 RepID=A0ABU3NXI8_9FIRM|nr:signal peptidase II [Selenomonadales bacterium 4137-cl]